jgi:hypothetical protein
MEARSCLEALGRFNRKPSTLRGFLLKSSPLLLSRIRRGLRWTAIPARFGLVFRREVITEWPVYVDSLLRRQHN